MSFSDSGWVIARHELPGSPTAHRFYQLATSRVGMCGKKIEDAVIVVNPRHKCTKCEEEMRARYGRTREAQS